jgi:DNA-binding beta-propeller fold protein YncE
MKRYSRRLVGLITVSVLGIASVPGCRADGPYHFLKDITVGGEGGWDYLSIDEAARRLYVSHATKIVVIDLDKDEVVGEIADTPGVHGLAPAPELQRGFTSNGRESKASIVDLKTLKTLSKVDTGENPDAVLYDPGQQEVYTFNGRGQSATVFETKTGKVVATIALPGRPEFPAVDPQAGRVYDNIEDKSTVVAIDTKTHQVTNTWAIAPGDGPSGMAIDVAHHRLFLGCHNKLMVMMDSVTGKVVGSVPIGDRVDANAFDPGTQFAFSSNGDGTVTVAHEESPDKLVVVQTLTTERGARTMALDLKTHRIYLATAKYEPQPAPTSDGARQRPKMIPGSFKILVYGMDKVAGH